MAQVQAILEAVDLQGKGISMLALEEGQHIWREWVVKIMEKKAAATVNSYLGSYQKFPRFVTATRINDPYPALDATTVLILQQVEREMSSWRSSVDQAKVAERNTKMLDECDDKVTNKDVTEFLLSKVAKDGFEIIKRAEEGKTLSMAEYCHALDITMMLMRYSGQCPSVIQNATIGHHAQRKREKDQEVICVPDHKWQASGPGSRLLGSFRGDLFEEGLPTIHQGHSGKEVDIPLDP